ncbi:DUF899 family protein [Streptomyces sp. NPDC057284]|uniref:DUF899 family protein n=1 Tax=Streptomyces sp. NPDC057284 TaxID=3346083 RepID=UPI00363732C6
MKACYLRDGDRVYEAYWTTGRGVEPVAPSYGILDMTVHGRQEIWEDSPAGWPQPYEARGQQFRKDGRPTAQWARLPPRRTVQHKHLKRLRLSPRPTATTESQDHGGS